MSSVFSMPIVSYLWGYCYSSPPLCTLHIGRAYHLVVWIANLNSLANTEIPILTREATWQQEGDELHTPNPPALESNKGQSAH